MKLSFFVVILHKKTYEKGQEVKIMLNKVKDLHSIVFYICLYYLLELADFSAETKFHKEVLL